MTPVWVDAPQSQMELLLTGETVALLAEDAGGMGKAVGRQLLRRRRPFTATILSPDGSQVICRVRRPFYFINVSKPYE